MDVDVIRSNSVKKILLLNVIPKNFTKSIFFTELLRVTSTSIPALLSQILIFIS